MFFVLVVYAVHFGSLKNVANPFRGFYIGMIKKLAQSGAQGVYSSGFGV